MIKLWELQSANPTHHYVEYFMDNSDRETLTNMMTAAAMLKPEQDELMAIMNHEGHWDKEGCYLPKIIRALAPQFFTKKKSKI